MPNPNVPGSTPLVNVNITTITGDPDVTSQYRTIILKKNVVNNVNTLTQAMFSRDNTKYVIKHDYILADDIYIPEHCILEFDGGSIGGSFDIEGRDTIISGRRVKLFGINTTFSGTWAFTDIYPEWFGAKADNIADDTDAINKALNSIKGNVIFTKSYNIEDNIESNLDGLIVSIYAPLNLNGKSFTLSINSILNLNGGYFYNNNNNLPSSVVLDDTKVFPSYDAITDSFGETYNGTISVSGDPYVGTTKFTTKPLWWNGTNWVDATGTSV